MLGGISRCLVVLVCVDSRSSINSNKHLLIHEHGDRDLDMEYIAIVLLSLYGLGATLHMLDMRAEIRRLTVEGDK